MCAQSAVTGVAIYTSDGVDERLESCCFECEECIRVRELPFDARQPCGIVNPLCRATAIDASKTLELDLARRIEAAVTNDTTRIEDRTGSLPQGRSISDVPTTGNGRLTSVGAPHALGTSASIRMKGV